MVSAVFGFMTLRVVALALWNRVFKLAHYPRMAPLKGSFYESPERLDWGDVQLSKLQ
jgi:hypothetical protein